MNTFKRLIVSVKGRIDHVAEELENHEALAEAAIQELTTIRNHTCRNLVRLKKAMAQTRASMEKMEQDIQRWKERAVRVRSRDEAKALECVRRMKETETRLQRQRTAFDQITRQYERSRADLERLDSRLDLMRRRKLLLAARQSAGRTEGSGWPTDGTDAAQLEAIFDRWEETVEAAAGREEDEILPEPDLEEAFRREEEAAELRALLDDLGHGDCGNGAGTGR